MNADGDQPAEHAPGKFGPDPRLLEIVVCPLSKTVLRYDPAAQELVSQAARLAFPIKDGIPILIPEEARRIEA
jgi:uncharacterized protein YbaR (Trm112 family)